MIPPSLRKTGGFSLLELLAAASVLVLIVLMILQITEGTARSVSQGNRHMDSDTEARMLFNRLAADFSRMLKRRDLDYSAFKQPAGVLAYPYRTAANGPVITPANPQPGNDRLAFYAETEGYFAGPSQPAASEKSPIALVAWQVRTDADTGQPALTRMARGLGWEQGNWGVVAHLPRVLSAQWPDVFDSAQDFKTVGDQTFRIEYTYLLKSRHGHPARLSLTPWDSDSALDPPHRSVDGFRDVSAIVVTIAVLDRSSRGIVDDFASLVATFPDAAEDAAGRVTNVAAVWNAIVDDPQFSTRVGMPRLAGSAVRIYERHFPLDTNR